MVTELLLCVNNFGIGEWINKGVALFNLGKYQEAIRCFERAVEKYDYIIKSLEEDRAHTLGLPCKLAYALNSMGASFSNIKGKMDEAINCFFEAMRIFEKSNGTKP